MILCEMEECIHHIFLKDEGKAYQHQCDNDKLEIGRNENGIPQCFSYVKEDS